MLPEKKPLSKRRKIVNALIIVLSFIFLLALVSFVRDFLFLNRHGYLSPSGKHHESFQAENIKPWMTFSFLNRTFDLPPEYLAEKLDITDKKYPNLTVNSLAKQKKADSGELIKQVGKFIEDYRKESPPPLINSI